MKHTIALLAILPGMAFATGSADLLYKGNGAGSNGKIKFKGNEYNVGVVQQRLKFSNVTSAQIANLNNTEQKVYCVDLSQWTDTKDKNTYAVVTADELHSLQGSPDKAQRLAALHTIWNYGLYGPRGNAWTTSDNDYATAFQLMTWELQYDYKGVGNSVDLGAGDFQFKSNLTAGAVTIFNEMKTKLSDKPTMANIAILKNDCKQDYVVPVPEPGTYVALAAGVAVLIGRRRR